MTPFGGLLNDEEVAAVVTYVRNSFGNKASVISPEQVKKVRDATKGKIRFLFTGRIAQTTSDGEVMNIIFHSILNAFHAKDAKRDPQRPHRLLRTLRIFPLRPLREMHLIQTPIETNNTMIKVGFNVLAWTAEVSEKLFPIADRLKKIGYDGVECFIGGR